MANTFGIWGAPWRSTYIDGLAVRAVKRRQLSDRAAKKPRGDPEDTAIVATAAAAAEGPLDELRPKYWTIFRESYFHDARTRMEFHCIRRNKHACIIRRTGYEYYKLGEFTMAALLLQRAVDLVPNQRGLLYYVLGCAHVAIWKAGTR
jgi:hypothetical protein